MGNPMLQDKIAAVEAKIQEALANRKLFYFIYDHSTLKTCVGYDVE